MIEFIYQNQLIFYALIFVIALAIVDRREVKWIRQ